jgi:acetyltransferase
VDLEALIEVLVRLSCLVADHPAIDSLDINPLLATPDGATALDARVFVNRRRLGLSVPPYPHLAIRPPTPDGAHVDLKGFTERFYQRDHLAKRTS